ncbi:hypothetical protein PROFUN_02058 [Planoprotostelium fungivorum]|uniref:EamA domain-containing protein n=1 Tax=Planoprotostelium fungivorum TaxID=1890364 RepID=A0A2P6NB91_9EUKA|nr:hypothetical protein PROFUN_02058 [Planoprotostelium fungivorum]
MSSTTFYRTRRGDSYVLRLRCVWEGEVTSNICQTYAGMWEQKYPEVGEQLQLSRSCPPLCVVVDRAMDQVITQQNISMVTRWIVQRRMAILLHVVLFGVQILKSVHVIAMKFATPFIHPFELKVYAALRFAFGLPVLFALAYLPGSTKIIPKGKIWIWVIVCPLFGVVMNNLFLVSAMRYATASTANILVPVVPTVTLLIGLFTCRESFTWTKVISVVLSFVGVVALSGIDRCTQFAEHHVLIGSLLLIGSFASAAVALVLQKKTLQMFPHSAVLTAWSMTVGGVIISTLSVTLSLTDLAPMDFYEVPLLAWFCVAFSGIGGTAMIFSGTAWSLTQTSVSTVSAYSCVQVLVGTFLSWLLLGETVSLMNLLGAPFILASLVLSVRDQYIKEREMKGKGTLVPTEVPEDEPPQSEVAEFVSIKVEEKKAEEPLLCSPRTI